MIAMQNSLTAHNTFRLTSSCERSFELTSADQLPNLLLLSQQYAMPLLVLGYGSNVILPAFYSGVVLLNRIKGVSVISETDDSVCVQVGAGEVWHDFVVYALSQEWYGLENLAMIPGSVGAAPVQNIGAYGVDLSFFLRFCDVFCRKTKRHLRLFAEDCQLAYRDSIFKSSCKGQYIILSVCFCLSKVPKLQYAYQRLNQYLHRDNAMKSITSRMIFDAVCSIRKSRLPCIKSVGTVGSFFVNPIVSQATFLQLRSQCAVDLDYYALRDGRYKLFAGNLLRLLGWRGYCFQGFSLCSINPIVMRHQGGGNHDDLVAFVRVLQDSVFRAFRIKLTLEPEFVAG